MFCIPKSPSNGRRKQSTHFASAANRDAKMRDLSPPDAFFCPSSPSGKLLPVRAGQAGGPSSPPAAALLRRELSWQQPRPLRRRGGCRGRGQQPVERHREAELERVALQGRASPTPPAPPPAPGPAPAALRHPPPRPPAAPRRRLVLLQCPAAEDPRGPPPHPRWLRAARPEATAERRSSSSMTGPGPSSSMAGAARWARG